MCTAKTCDRINIDLDEEDVDYDGMTAADPHCRMMKYIPRIVDIVRADFGDDARFAIIAERPCWPGAFADSPLAPKLKYAANRERLGSAGQGLYRQLLLRRTTSIVGMRWAQMPSSFSKLVVTSGLMSAGSRVGPFARTSESPSSPLPGKPDAQGNHCHSISSCTSYTSYQGSCLRPSDLRSLTPFCRPRESGE